MNSLTEWQNFYMIVGSSAGALTGLQFVVMALIADMPIAKDEPDAGDAFATPTIVHFVAVLMLSALAAVPWHALRPAALIWGVAGLAGVAYTLIVLRRMTTQTVYKPVFEDWIFHALLPLAAYAGLAASGLAAFGLAGFAATAHTTAALFGLAGVSLLLLFIGIHNAWDNVTYLVFTKRPKTKK
jgi:hypothetical protein